MIFSQLLQCKHVYLIDLNNSIQCVVIITTQNIRTSNVSLRSITKLRVWFQHIMSAFCFQYWGDIFGLIMQLSPFTTTTGIGPVSWLINTEIYPTWASSFCNGCSTAASWISNLIVSMTFLSLTQAITHHGLFVCLSVCLLSCFRFIMKALTKQQQEKKTAWKNKQKINKQKQNKTKKQKQNIILRKSISVDIFIGIFLLLLLLLLLLLHSFFFMITNVLQILE